MIKPLTAAQLAARPDYVAFLQSAPIGTGGMASVADEGVGKLSLKNRLTAAAAAAGVTIKYKRSGADSVVFEVVGRNVG